MGAFPFGAHHGPTFHVSHTRWSYDRLRHGARLLGGLLFTSMGVSSLSFRTRFAVTLAARRPLHASTVFLICIRVGFGLGRSVVPRVYLSAQSLCALVPLGRCPCPSGCRFPRADKLALRPLRPGLLCLRPLFLSAGCFLQKPRNSPGSRGDLPGRVEKQLSGRFRVD